MHDRSPRVVETGYFGLGLSGWSPSGHGKIFRPMSRLRGQKPLRWCTKSKSERLWLKLFTAFGRATSAGEKPWRRWRFRLFYWSCMGLVGCDVKGKVFSVRGLVGRARDCDFCLVGYRKPMPKRCVERVTGIDHPPQSVGSKHVKPLTILPLYRIMARPHQKFVQSHSIAVWNCHQ